MALYVFFTMVQKCQKGPKTQIKGEGSCLYSLASQCRTEAGISFKPLWIIQHLFYGSEEFLNLNVVPRSLFSVLKKKKKENLPVSGSWQSATLLPWLARSVWQGEALIVPKSRQAFTTRNRSTCTEILQLTWTLLQLDPLYVQSVYIILQNFESWNISEKKHVFLILHCSCCAYSCKDTEQQVEYGYDLQDFFKRPTQLSGDQGQHWYHFNGCSVNCIDLPHCLMSSPLQGLHWEVSGGSQLRLAQALPSEWPSDRSCLLRTLSISVDQKSRWEM